MRRAVPPDVFSITSSSSSTEPASTSSSITPAAFSSSSRAVRYTWEPCVRSEAAASSQSGEKPKAKIEPTSTTLPAALRFAISPAPGPGSLVGDPSTPPTSSIITRSRFLAVTSYRRERRTNRGSVSSKLSCSVPPEPGRAGTHRALGNRGEEPPALSLARHAEPPSGLEAHRGRLRKRRAAGGRRRRAGVTSRMYRSRNCRGRAYRPTSLVPAPEHEVERHQVTGSHPSGTRLTNRRISAIVQLDSCASRSSFP